MKKYDVYRILVKATKIAVGSCLSIYLAKVLGLEYGASAGVIALLTILTTRWETISLSLNRFFSFFVSVVMANVFFQYCPSEWIAYGLFIFMLVIICDMLGWTATLSVNAVIGTHFLTTHDFSAHFVLNEFLLVAIGISVAIVVNSFHLNSLKKKNIIFYMRYTEEQLQTVLGELATYLDHKPMTQNVWDDIISLENQLKFFHQLAYEYQENAMKHHATYYSRYFEMRMQQCSILHNLHYQIKKIRSMPAQAHIIADYIFYLKDFVVELNDPKAQIDKLNKIFENMKDEPLPSNREEFESRAMLYHILLDLQEFLIFKRRFVDSLNEKQREIYWVDNSIRGEEAIG